MIFIFGLVAGFAFAQGVDNAILFVDFNGAQSEIDAAQKFAKANGRHFVVVPEVSREQRRQQQKLDDTLTDLLDERVTANCASADACGQVTPRCEALQKKVDDVREKLVALGAQFKDLLDAGLKKLVDNKVQPTTVILSGHDGGGAFSGIWGRMEGPEIEQSFSAVQELSGKIKFLGLWGCFTVSLSELERLGKVFPGLLVTQGHDKLAPLHTDARSAAQLTSSLAAEKEALAANTPEKMARLRRKVIGGRGVPLAIGAHGILSGSAGTDRIADLEAALKDCMAKFPEALHEKYLCYYRGLSGCEKIPTNHYKSELRDYYEYLRNNGKCVNNPANPRSFPTPEKVLSLIFYDSTVASNFMRNHASEIEIFNYNVKFAGAPELVLTPERIKSRGAMREWQAMVEAFWGRKGIPLSEEQISRLNVQTSFMSNLLVNLISVPRLWYGTDSPQRVDSSLLKYFEKLEPCPDDKSAAPAPVER